MYLVAMLLEIKEHTAWILSGLKKVTAPRPPLNSERNKKSFSCFRSSTTLSFSISVFVYEYLSTVKT